MSSAELLTALQQIVNVWYPLPLVADPQAKALALTRHTSNAWENFTV